MTGTVMDAFASDPCANYKKMFGGQEQRLTEINAQIEYVLRDALRKSGRSKPKPIEPIIDPEI